MLDRRHQRVARAIDRRLLHYTDHLCRLADPTAGSPAPWIGTEGEGFGTGRFAWFGACPASAARPTSGRTLRFTTDRAAVTCPRCLTGLAQRDQHDAERPAGAVPASDAARQSDAYEQCCAARGCAPPATLQAAREADLEHRRERAVRRVVVGARQLVAAKAMGTGETFEAWLTATLESVPPEVFESLRPVIYGTEIAAQAAERAWLALSEGLETMRGAA